MTVTQALGLILLYTLAVCVAYDLVFSRPDRVARRRAEARALRLHRELERRDRADAVRPLGTVPGSETLTLGPEIGTGGGEVVQLPASRPGPRRRRRTDLRSVPADRRGA